MDSGTSLVPSDSLEWQWSPWYLGPLSPSDSFTLELWLQSFVHQILSSFVVGVFLEVFLGSFAGMGLLSLTVALATWRKQSG